ncbi:MAG: hypothetical protein Q8J68_08095 [Methanolobus sp.]|uniref:hypothetical protein n=1 Tax=Methanolobus sp. TaxID=1874737 RepID=UPI00272F1753|nr:hypothetical protein [Methanolobus sp.]MDP2217230.1 hypothetical protein [Methanolobus sp.]
MSAIDTSEMLCTCGKKLNYAGTDNGCHVLVCPVHSKKSYRIPVDQGTLPFPLETLMVKKYNCKDCGADIEKGQALRTFEEEGGRCA